jgi:ABC-type sugar transport system ATPase subunit
MLEIVRAVERNSRVLLLDEATSALGDNEVAWLAELIGGLRNSGATSSSSRTAGTKSSASAIAWPY